MYLVLLRSRGQIEQKFQPTLTDYFIQGVRNIESNTGKSAKLGNLTRGCRRFLCLALFAGVWFYFSLLSAVFSLLFDSYVLLADAHVDNVSYFPFMSIKQVVPYFCVLREGYYVIIWLIVRICVFIKDCNFIYSELFILKRKTMEAVDINLQHAFFSKMHVIFLSCTSAR